MRDINQALSLLMARAAPNLSDDDLLALGGASDLAAMQARNLGIVMDSLGALVANDEGSGYMQEKNDVSALLWHVANVAESITALIELSDQVDVRRTYGPVKVPSGNAVES